MVQDEMRTKPAHGAGITPVDALRACEQSKLRHGQQSLTAPDVLALPNRDDELERVHLSNDALLAFF